LTEYIKVLVNVWILYEIRAKVMLGIGNNYA